MFISRRIERRSVLKGLLQGTAVTVGLPLLDCFLTGNGTALAATNEQIPIRFGTWFWGLGMSPSVFIPNKTGVDFDLPEEIACLEAVRKEINLFTGFNVQTDGRPNLCHFTGSVALRCGEAPRSRADLSAKSIDVAISDHLGDVARFRQLDCAATGEAALSLSFRGPDAINPPEISPLELYTKVFGPDFRDPNRATFTPNPELMLRKSVLSGILEQNAAFQRGLGAEDKARLDEYYTSIRQLERRLEKQLQRPPRVEGFRKPESPSDIPVGIDVEIVQARHRAMTDLLVAAIASDQTRVFNMAYSGQGSGITRAGSEMTHHVTTHEESVDPKLGYQAKSSWFLRRSMQEWAYFVGALAKVREGDGTLLDNTLVYAHSESREAKIHSLDGIPMFTAGRAGGKLKTGLHVSGNGDPGTRLGYTLQKVMGLGIPSWGAQSMETSREIAEILA